ncbi:uncharacterized protein LOC143585387 [Bidens hawaiensis]|uniref:uncharacterized protein LOC143585387 n=1 Tax=Bidens hawaiensis TaxID=980011 RepID=UPI00404B5D5B
MRENRMDMLKEEFNKFKHIQGESIASLINRFESLVTELSSVGIIPRLSKINMKLLDSLPYAWYSSVITIRGTTNLDILTLSELTSTIKSWCRENKGETSDASVSSQASPIIPECAANGSSQANTSSSSTNGIPTPASLIPEVHKLCSQAFIDKVLHYRNHNAKILEQIDSIRVQNDDLKKPAKIYTIRINIHGNDMADLREKVSIARNLAKRHENQVVELNAKIVKLEIELTQKKIAIENFELATEKLNKLIGSQMELRLKTGLGYDSSVVPTPFNNNYTSVPHLDFNSPPEEEMVYGIGHVPISKTFVPAAPKIVISANSSVNPNNDSSSIAGCVEEKGCVETNKGCGDKNVLFDSSIVNPICNNIDSKNILNNDVFDESVQVGTTLENENDVSIYDSDSKTIFDETIVDRNVHEKVYVNTNLPSCSSNSCKVKETKVNENCFEKEKASISGKYVPPHRNNFYQSTNQYYQPQLYNQFDNSYYGYYPQDYVNSFYTNVFDDRGHRSDNLFVPVQPSPYSPQPMYYNSDGFYREDKRKLHCKSWHKMKRETNSRFNQFRSRAKPSSRTRNDQPDSSASEMDVRSINKKNDKPPFWITKKERAKRNSKTDKSENSSKRKQKRHPKIEKSEDVVLKLRRRQSRKSVRNRKPVHAWNPKDCSSDSDTSHNFINNNEKRTFDNLVVEPPETTKSREPVSN